MDDLVVVGGLAPSLLVAQDDQVEAHVGAMDLDVGLTVALLDEGRYQALTERLRRAGFSQDENEDGKPTRQRWKITQTEKVTVDFLIQPTRPEDRGGRLRDIEADFAAGECQDSCRLERSRTTPRLTSGPGDRSIERRLGPALLARRGDAVSAVSDARLQTSPMS